eukprot:CAMPEP_0197698418 /NCGR_PEP_ID=MMETSP1338-20131121/119330_1 /TAXON_ID=43686 ORGANISM="Pelagodinium beii, Strain RCC1491" /NCGR_SAMPLE_ID=MMETSP1338 /ASSEMBLY_ACC=CAM_ASM_000754 /LENGTH=34 /DNA_ID= /DNA_START= /DNA_END= /DNA_ORIENTATION=
MMIGNSLRHSLSEHLAQACGRLPELLEQLQPAPR